MDRRKVVVMTVVTGDRYNWNDDGPCRSIIL